jgi:hypothetical protein
MIDIAHEKNDDDIQASNRGLCCPFASIPI